MRVVLSIILFLCLPLWAQETAPTFVEGVKAYESKEFQKSKDIFTQLFEQHPKNPAVLYNLGLAEYNLGQKGLALGLWRKARFISPDLESIEKAIQFVESELFPDQESTGVFYTIYKALKVIPLFLWLLLAFVSFCTFFWLAISLSAKRKIPLSQWPPWQFVLIPVFLFSLSFSLWLTKETMELKATVILPGVATHTGPSETAPTLSNLMEGELIFVEKLKDNWVQIRTMTGAPGWVESKSLIIIER